MATDKQRRSAERQRLQRQLAERRQHDAARKRFVLISSVAGTLALIVVLVIVLAVTLGGGDDKPAAGPSTGTPKGSTGASTPEAQPCSTAGLPGVVKFQGVSVGNATNLTKEPKVCSSSRTDPTKLQVKDLVVGKGKSPALTQDVTVQYTGVQYKSGDLFDSSWARNQPAPFNLQRVVGGFTQGIGGNAQSGIAPMKIGGRRIVIVPSALGYGAQGTPDGKIPPNTSLVFVIDLLKVG